jgi:hypothetical protein
MVEKYGLSCGYFREHNQRKPRKPDATQGDRLPEQVRSFSDESGRQLIFLENVKTLLAIFRQNARMTECLTCFLRARQDQWATYQFVNVLRGGGAAPLLQTTPEHSSQAY